MMNKFSITFASFFLISLLFVGYQMYLPVVLVLGYWVLSLLTFILYACDKSRAKKGEWRIREKYLHLLAMVGGWPGALITQQTLRHKSQKVPFRFMLTPTIIFNIAISAWLVSPVLREFLTSFSKFLY